MYIKVSLLDSESNEDMKGFTISFVKNITGDHNVKRSLYMRICFSPLDYDKKKAGMVQNQLRKEIDAFFIFGLRFKLC